MVLVVARWVKPPAESPAVVGQALQDITLPEGVAPLPLSKVKDSPAEACDKARIVYNLDREESLTAPPVRPPPPARGKGLKSRSSSKSSRSSHSSRSSSGSRSPARKRSPRGDASDTEKKKEKKIVEVSGSDVFIHCLALCVCLNAELSCISKIGEFCQNAGKRNFALRKDLMISHSVYLKRQNIQFNVFI